MDELVDTPVVDDGVVEVGEAVLRTTVAGLTVGPALTAVVAAAATRLVEDVRADVTSADEVVTATAMPAWAQAPVMVVASVVPSV